MPSRFVQSIINQVQEAIDRVVGVVNEKNTIIACGDLTKIGSNKNIGVAKDNDANGVADDTFLDDEYTYKIFNFQPNLKYIIFVKGVDEIAKQFAKMISIMLKNSKKHYDEKYNKNDFIRNISLNNILPSDIYVKAREFNLKVEVERVTFLIKAGSVDNVIVYETLNNMFVENNKDFIFNVNSSDIALIKELPFQNGQSENIKLNKMAEEILETLKSKISSKILIGFSSQVDNIKKLEQSFKEANVALNIGEIFSDTNKIVNYNKLGIFRIIYQLPTTLCDTFLKEVFKKMSLESLDKETFSTIYSFFENNLNVSETSKKLFIHRNTLVYRLEKIKRLTGLDLKKFEDAIIFKIAIMIKKYLKFILSKI